MSNRQYGLPLFAKQVVLEIFLGSRMGAICFFGAVDGYADWNLLACRQMFSRGETANSFDGTLNDQPSNNL